MNSTYGHHNIGDTDDLLVDSLITAVILLFMAVMAWPFPSWDPGAWNFL